MGPNTVALKSARPLRSLERPVDVLQILLCLRVRDGIDELLPEIARFVIEQVSGISKRVAGFSKGDENGAQHPARQRRFVRVFVTPHAGECLHPLRLR